MTATTMRLSLTKANREAIADVATIEGGGEDGMSPEHPTLYAMWERGELKIGSELELPESEWVSLIGSLLCYHNGKATRSLFRRAVLAVEDAKAFSKQCFIAAGWESDNG